MKLNKRNSLKDFPRSDDGSATIEAVLWIPVFIAFLTLAADASLIFFGQNRAYRIIQDANRNLSVGRLQSEEEVIDYLNAEIGLFAPHATVTASIDSGMITSTASIPAADLTATNLFSAFVDLDFTVVARHYVEY